MLRGDLFWDSRCSIRVGFCWFRIMKKERTKERIRKEREKKGRTVRKEGRKKGKKSVKIKRKEEKEK